MSSWASAVVLLVVAAGDVQHPTRAHVETSDHFFYREKAGGRLCCQASMSHKHEQVWEDLGPEWVRLKRLGGGAHG